MVTTVAVQARAAMMTRKSQPFKKNLTQKMMLSKLSNSRESMIRRSNSRRPPKPSTRRPLSIRRNS